MSWGILLFMGRERIILDRQGGDVGTPGGIRRILVSTVALFCIALLLPLYGCDSGPIAVNKRFAETVEAYYADATEILEEFKAADDEVRRLTDKVYVGETLTASDKASGEEALSAMDAAHQQWLVLEAPDVEVREIHLKVEEAMRMIRSADKGLFLAISTGDNPAISDANAERTAAIELLLEAQEDLGAWKEQNGY